MDGIYLLLVKATLVAAVILVAVSVVTAIALDTVAIVPMAALAVVAGLYARWQMSRTSA